MFFCEDCIGDPILRSHIAGHGEVAECSFGHGERRVLELEELGRIVDPVYRRYHKSGDSILVPLPDHLGDSECVQLGDGPDLQLGEMLQAEPHVIEPLVEHLASAEAYEVAHDGSEAMYDNATNYVFMAPSTATHVQTWGRFADRVKHERRFLDRENMSDLASILGDADDLSKASWLSIRTLEPSDGDDPILFRARRCNGTDQAWKVLSHPVAELGPPPRDSAAVNRMNPAGIPVFYGAFEFDTAVAEIRPWVSALIVVGGFRPNRDLRLLDLSGIQRGGSPSMFSASFEEEYARWSFLREFEAIVSRPIGPHESQVEFLPTQIVAEYVESVLGLDGIVYGSAQNEGGGMNVVVFPDREADSPLGLDLVHSSVQCVEVIANVTSYKTREDLHINDLAALFDRFPRLTRMWNDNQMKMVTAILDPSISYEDMAASLRGVVEDATMLVTSMAYLAASFEDEGVREAVMDVVANYRDRLALVREMVGAAMTSRYDDLDDLRDTYAQVSHVDRVRPLVKNVYDHERVRPFVEARGFSVDRFLDSFFGSL